MKLIEKFKNLPFTETFSKTFKGLNFDCADAKLLIKESTSEIILESETTIDYESNSYCYGTSSSTLSNTDLQMFLNLFYEIKNKLPYDLTNVLEFGGNDLKLAKLISKENISIDVVDPASNASEKTLKEYPKINVHTIYDFELDYSFLKKTNLIVLSRHTIEHIPNPIDHFLRLSKALPEKTIYIYEFPCINSLISSLRFDAIFHQHVNYFDLFSFGNIIEKAGFEIIDFNHNITGSCGGAMQVVFTKDKNITKTKKKFPYKKLTYDEYINFFKNSKKIYKNYCDHISYILENSQHPILGYGAALMLPTFFYHSGINPNSIEFILDDDPSKNNLTYTNVPLTVKNPNDTKFPSEWSCLLTSNESARPIFKACTKYNPLKILSTLGKF